MKFLFFIDISVPKNKNEEKAVLLMEHLEGCFSNLFHDVFHEDEQLTKESWEYIKQKQAFLKETRTKNLPEDKLRIVIETIL